MNQSNSLYFMSNNLNNSTKDNIFLQRLNKFNIVKNLNEKKLEIPNNSNFEKYNNVIYNIINVDNINNINNNKKNIIPKSLYSFSTNDKMITIKAKQLNNNNNDKILEIKEEQNELSEREKKLFEKENELTNKENEINNKILELIQKNRKLNEQGKKQIQKNSIMNDVINFKKVVSDYEENKDIKNKNKKIEKLENKEIII